MNLGEVERELDVEPIAWPQPETTEAPSEERVEQKVEAA